MTIDERDRRLSRLRAAATVTRLLEWGGWPLKTFLVLFATALLGSLGTVFAAPLAAIPIAGLFAFLVSPFPTAACYIAAALLAYFAVMLALRFVPIGRAAAQLVAAVLALLAAQALGTGVAKHLNAQAGIQVAAPQAAPSAVTLRKGGEIALIGSGNPNYVQCNALCFSLLLEEQASAVSVGASSQEPAPFEVLRGRRYYLTPQTRTCLKGQRADNIWRADRAFRNKLLTEAGVIPREYEKCLGNEPAEIDPSGQLTLVEWVKGDVPDEFRRPGYSANVALIRTVVPTTGGSPEVRQARFRSGWRFSEPLSISPYGGNAGSGGYFSPRVSVRHFREPGFPNTLNPPFLSLLRDSHSLWLKTAAGLDTVAKAPDH